MRLTFLRSPKKQVHSIGFSHLAIKFSSVTEGETQHFPDLFTLQLSQAEGSLEKARPSHELRATAICPEGIFPFFSVKESSMDDALLDKPPLIKYFPWGLQQARL